MLDLVVKGGTVVDGSGAPRYRADIGVTDGCVVEIGSITERSLRTIDADGAVVAPGFVDIHTHYDAQVFWDPTLSPSSLHGVTTVLGGNCGFSIQPLMRESADYMCQMLARVEGMSLDALRTGLPWDWSSTAEYLDRLEGHLSVNAGFMVGHSAIRRFVMGEHANERTATTDEIRAMASLLRGGLAAGGMGFSSSYARSHNDATGLPVPSRFADGAELVALAGVCREYAGTSLEFLPEVTDPQEPLSSEAVRLMVSMSTAAQRPLNWNVVRPTRTNLAASKEKLRAGTVAAEHGGRVVALMMPPPSSIHLNFLTGFVLDALPGWEAPMALPPAEKLSLLLASQHRRRLEELAGAPNPVRRFADWPRHVITQTFGDATKRYEGRMVGEIAGEEGKRPFDALLDIVCLDELRTRFSVVSPPHTDDDWSAGVSMWRDGRAVIGGSDAGAHLDMIAGFSYPTEILRAARTTGLATIEEVVQVLTDIPARLYGLRGRGRICPGSAADLVVMDEHRVAPAPVESRFDLPGGAGRLFASSEGIDHVVVNGTEICSGGRFTGETPGKVLRSRRDSYTPSLSPGAPLMPAR
jgi:N-acyl-D-aspartate/D-glutamate deacylase